MKYKQLYPTDDYSNIDEIISNSDKNLEHLITIDNVQAEKNLLLYRYFRIQVADGYVYYQVTKVGKNISEVTLCNGICLDDYSENALGNFTKMMTTNVQKIINF